MRAKRALSVPEGRFLGRVPKRLYLVFCDHSIAGVWLTKRGAMEAARMRSVRGPLHFVAGPYVLREAGK